MSLLLIDLQPGAVCGTTADEGRCRGFRFTKVWGVPAIRGKMVDGEPMLHSPWYHETWSFASTLLVGILMDMEAGRTVA
jgi:hypothetical protein